MKLEKSTLKFVGLNSGTRCSESILSSNGDDPRSDLERSTIEGNSPVVGCRLRLGGNGRVVLFGSTALIRWCVPSKAKYLSRDR